MRKVFRWCHSSSPSPGSLDEASLGTQVWPMPDLTQRHTQLERSHDIWPEFAFAHPEFSATALAASISSIATLSPLLRLLPAHFRSTTPKRQALGTACLPNRHRWLSCVLHASAPRPWDEPPTHRPGPALEVAVRSGRSEFPFSLASRRSPARQQALRDRGATGHSRQDQPPRKWALP